MAMFAVVTSDGVEPLEDGDVWSQVFVIKKKRIMPFLKTKREQVLIDISRIFGKVTVGSYWSTL